MFLDPFFRLGYPPLFYRFSRPQSPFFFWIDFIPHFLSIFYRFLTPLFIDFYPPFFRLFWTPPFFIDFYRFWTLLDPPLFGVPPPLGEMPRYPHRNRGVPPPPGRVPKPPMVQNGGYPAPTGDGTEPLFYRIETYGLPIVYGSVGVRPLIVLQFYGFLLF